MEGRSPVFGKKCPCFPRNEGLKPLFYLLASIFMLTSTAYGRLAIPSGRHLDHDHDSRAGASCPISAQKGRLKLSILRGIPDLRDPAKRCRSNGLQNHGGTANGGLAG